MHTWKQTINSGLCLVCIAWLQNYYCRNANNGEIDILQYFEEVLLAVSKHLLLE